MSEDFDVASLEDMGLVKLDLAVNRCELDGGRRERALHDAALIERNGDMERRIAFYVGFDHTKFPEDCGGGGHGLHGMTMSWVLIGPKGAVNWDMYLNNWVPGNTNSIGGVLCQDPVSVIPANGILDDGMAWDLGYHTSVPSPDLHGPNKCEFLSDHECYYDGSGLAAQPLLDAFLEHGPQAIWAALARFYGRVFTEDVTDG
jgi:hypothetical protein